MNLTADLKSLKSRSKELSLTERVELSCRLSKQLEKAGEYETACEALSEFWPDRFGPPVTEGLNEASKAKILLRVGALAGWLGSARQTDGSQETAKNLITQSLEIFEKLGSSEEASEAQSDLALCYWREGSFDEARIHLADALRRLGDLEIDLKVVILIRSGMVEVTAGRFNEALRFYEIAAPLVGRSTDHALKGAFHNELGAVLNDMGLAEQREDYIDRALVEFAAASFHFEQAENYRYLARVENNLGFLFFTIGRHGEAHKHLDRARLLFVELDDVGTVAQIDDTRARTLLAEGRLVEAERFARSAVKTLEKGGEQSLLAEALNTQAIVLARKGAFTSAKGLLERAIAVANTAGDPEGAGRASLSILEELNQQTPPKELLSAYRSAVDLLRGSQDPVVSKRLFACARTVIDALAASIEDDDEAKDHTWEGFSFKQSVLNYEKRLIEHALKDAGTSVTAAARLLGFKHHQNLIAVINSRHKDLLKTRSAVRKRRRHLFSEPRKTKSRLAGIARPAQTTAQVSVLHVEDNKQIGRLIQDTLAAEEIHVDSCVSGTVAMEILKSDARYDAIIVDNDLPGLSGLELILRVRSMAKRRDTPIIMLSGDDCEKEAWRAGAKAFLKKPEQISELSATVARLLRSRASRKTKVGNDLG